jgi:hypothetical protein
VGIPHLPQNGGRLSPTPYPTHARSHTHARTHTHTHTHTRTHAHARTQDPEQTGLLLTFLSVTVVGEVTPLGALSVRLVKAGARPGGGGPALVVTREPKDRTEPFPGALRLHARACTRARTHAHARTRVAFSLTHSLTRARARFTRCRKNAVLRQGSRRSAADEGLGGAAGLTAALPMIRNSRSLRNACSLLCIVLIVLFLEKKIGVSHFWISKVS